ncbi:hypothetical protein V6N11_024637 [Hibiscus sabdariffa]|uniref:Secreted protein n=1 Tax=Hibiscus sabdariffa TaxID=183260 RepID=A0ABR2QN50_9ROSI
MAWESLVFALCMQRAGSSVVQSAFGKFPMQKHALVGLLPARVGDFHAYGASPCTHCLLLVDLLPEMLKNLHRFQLQYSRKALYGPKRIPPSVDDDTCQPWGICRDIKTLRKQQVRGQCAFAFGALCFLQTPRLTF